MLDIAAHGLRIFSDVRITRWPRMADFVQWGTTCESAFMPPGTFLRAYSENRRAVRDGVLDADPVAARVRGLMARYSTWSGSASDLLRAGAAPTGFPSIHGGWPHSPRALAGRLRPRPDIPPDLGDRNRLWPRRAVRGPHHQDEFVGGIRGTVSIVQKLPSRWVAPRATVETAMTSQ